MKQMIRASYSFVQIMFLVALVFVGYFLLFAPAELSFTNLKDYLLSKSPAELFQDPNFQLMILALMVPTFLVIVFFILSGNKRGRDFLF